MYYDPLALYRTAGDGCDCEKSTKNKSATFMCVKPQDNKKSHLKPGGIFRISGGDEGN